MSTFVDANDDVNVRETLRNQQVLYLFFRFFGPLQRKHKVLTCRLIVATY